MQSIHPCSYHQQHQTIFCHMRNTVRYRFWSTDIYKQSTTCLGMSLNLSFFSCVPHERYITYKIPVNSLMTPSNSKSLSGHQFARVKRRKKRTRREREEKRGTEYITTDADINGKRSVLFSFYFYRARARRLTKV